MAIDIKNIFEGDGINQALGVALLADFSKSCGLISDKDFSNVVSDKVRNISSNYGYVYSSQPVDYKLFNSQPTSVFKESISTLIYNTFFKLLQTDQAFLTIMAPNLINFQKGVITAQDLRMIILDNLDSEITIIIEKLAKGEQLTAEEITQTVTSALKNKGPQISKQGIDLAASKAVSADGLSNYTPYSNLAISQRYKGIRWKPIKGTSLSPKALDKLEKATKNIKTALTQAKGALNTAKSLVSLLRALESIFSNGYVALLKSLSKIIFSYVRDIGSSGVYVLDMITPYYGGFYSVPETKNKEKFQRDRLLSKLSRKNVTSTYEHFNNDIINTMPGLSNLTETEMQNARQNSKFVTGVEEIFDLSNLNAFYKPTTYAAFIRVIADSFFDEGDKPSESFLNSWDAPAVFKNLSDKYGKGAVKRTDDVIKIPFSGGIEIDAAAVRPGRPIFGNGSNSVVVIVAFSMPNFIQLATASAATLQGMVLAFYFLLGIDVIEDKPEVGKYFRDHMSKPFKKINNALGRIWSKMKKSKLADYYNDKPYYDEDGKIMLPTDISEKPDFYGFAVRSLFPDFFELLDILEVEIDKWTKNFKSALSKELDDLLDFIEETIDDLEDFVNLIDMLINFFNALKTMGLYTLQITSNGGNEDLVEKMMVAEGFPEVDKGDPLRLIGGVVFCYGAPNLKPGNIDFQGIIKQQMVAMQYDAAITKYQSGAGKDPNDDPGTFEEFINKSGMIGMDYNSALDKIFKKLF